MYSNFNLTKFSLKYFHGYPHSPKVSQSFQLNTYKNQPHRTVIWNSWSITSCTSNTLAPHQFTTYQELNENLHGNNTCLTKCIVASCGAYTQRKSCISIEVRLIDDYNLLFFMVHLLTFLQIMSHVRNLTLHRYYVLQFPNYMVWHP